MGTLLTPPLLCTVRDCKGLLAWDGAQLRCPAGHAFDRARQGYWNLLQPQDRRSAKPGDRDLAVLARGRWLARGFADGLRAELAARIDALDLPPGSVAIDVGCGEGTMTSGLLSGRALSGCGIDLSTVAIRQAAKLDPALTWIVANADRGLPFGDGEVALALSIFGRRPTAALARVLKSTGTLIVVVPAEDDLIELREASQGEGLRRDRSGEVMRDLGARFTLVDRSIWRHRAHHDRAALDDALAMTYRGARERERERFAEVTELGVTLSAEILALVPRGGVL